MLKIKLRKTHLRQDLTSWSLWTWTVTRRSNIVTARHSSKMKTYQHTVIHDPLVFQKVTVSVHLPTQMNVRKYRLVLLT